MSPHFSPSEFVSAKSPRQVVRLLQQYRDKALILGGGTLIHGLAERGVLGDKQLLIDLQHLRLDYVKSDSKGVKIGAMTTFAGLEESSALRNDPTLAAIEDSLVYPPAQIKNLATVGGSIASSFPAFDLPIAFTVLDGIARATGPLGNRQIHLRKLFVGYLENSLKRGEFITELYLPRLPRGSASAFTKLETNANDLAILNVGVWLGVDGSGSCNDARIVVGGGVGGVPLRAISAEKALKDNQPSERILEEAGEVAATELKFVDDVRATSKYRSAVAKVLVRRTLKRAFERTRGVRAR